jgi:hypothetical protein
VQRKGCRERQHGGNEHRAQHPFEKGQTAQEGAFWRKVWMEQHVGENRNGQELDPGQQPQPEVSMQPRCQSEADREARGDRDEGGECQSNMQLSYMPEKQAKQPTHIWPNKPKASNPQPVQDHRG